MCMYIKYIQMLQIMIELFLYEGYMYFTHYYFLTTSICNQLVSFNLGYLSFHICFICQHGVWHLYMVPDRVLFNANHVCPFKYTREITVIDERGKGS